MFEYGEDEDDDGAGSDASSSYDPYDDVAALMSAAVARLAQPRSDCHGCHRSVPATALHTLSGRQVGSLPARALGNAFERGVLIDYLDAKGMSIDALYAELLRRVASGELTLAHRVEEDRLCGTCFDAAFSDLLLQYRRAIPPAELPATVTGRPDCWYGTTCRTQTHNAQHAARLNHICQPTRGASGGRPLGSPAAPHAAAAAAAGPLSPCPAPPPGSD